MLIDNILLNYFLLSHTSALINSHVIINLTNMINIRDIYLIEPIIPPFIDNGDIHLIELGIPIIVERADRDFFPLTNPNQ